jgi:hypothetical protein
MPAPEAPKLGHPPSCYTKLFVHARSIVERLGEPDAPFHVEANEPGYRVFDRVCASVPFLAPLTGEQLFAMCAQRAGIDVRDGKSLHRLAAYIVGGERRESTQKQ